MSESTGQFQVAGQPVTIQEMGLPGATLLRLITIASQTGNVLEVINPAGNKALQIDVNGNVILGDGTTAANLTSALGKVVGGKANVISGLGATRTLLASESGATVLFDRAAGIVITLPPPAVGLYFDFIVTTTITSNNAEVDTDAGTTFLLGAVEILTSASAVTFGAYANGTSTVKIQLNGTTKGGILGSQFRMVCVSATQWQVSGILAGSGSEATPFS